MKNRNIFPRTGAFLLIVCLSTQLQAQKTIDLVPTTSTSQIYEIKTKLEGRGVVIPEDEKAVRLHVDGEFHYHERVIARTSQLKSVRDYKDANAKIRIADKPMINELSSDKRIIIAQTKATDQPIKIASLGGPITQHEFELLNTPANTLILTEIFAKRSIKKGDNWKPRRQTLARFLNIDSVDTTDVQIELASIKGNTAVMVIAGDVQGTIDGASTSLSLNGTVNFEIDKGFVTQSQITISQQRDVGLIAPGLDATFKLATIVRQNDQSDSLTDKGLAKLKENAGRISDRLLLSANRSEIAMLHTRGWRVITNAPGRTTLRYTLNGKMIGQCDIIPLPNRLPDQQQTLEQFRAVVKNKLEGNSGEITNATQARNSQGLEWLRVDATGTSNNVNLNWSYYTLNHEDGRRVQLIFTTEPSHRREFSGKDHLLVDTLRFKATNKAPASNAGYRKSAK